MLNADSSPYIISDSTLVSPEDTVHIRYRNYTPVSVIDTSKVSNYWKITRRTGEITPAVPDTFLTDYFNRTNVEGAGLSVAYLGNLGLPMESRVFFDRKDRSEFMFADTYWAYLKKPDNQYFLNTRVPYTNISYQSAGSRENKEERFRAIMSVNYGKKLNFGIDIDYLYARGFYDSQGAKIFDWVLFGNYISDRHQAHWFINPGNYRNGENGGLADDRWITHPEQVEGQNAKSKTIPTNISNTWNYQKGKQYYLNYRYNLGFEQNTGQTDEEGNQIKQFIPVSSIIYTFDYEDRSRRFYTRDSVRLDEFYNNVDFLHPNRLKKEANDRTSYHSIKNTVALSLREGFHELAKFDLTAFIMQENRKFTLMDTIPTNDNYSAFSSSKTTQNSTYIGGELRKKTGSILTYQAQGSFGVVGYNQADYNLSGTIQTRIPLFKQMPSVTASAYLKNLSPTFYENHYHSQYFWWDKDFDKVNKVFIGGTIDFPWTNTNFSLGVENLKNYIYFDANGYPAQHKDNIQILAATLRQNFKFGIFNWDTQAVYQKSSNDEIIPLPDIALYSSLYMTFKIAKVLTIQMGGNIHFWTEYHSPTYNPATQQFMLQDKISGVKTGNYPLVSGFINCHLKQTRFFLQYYNAAESFITPPEYFSLPHYPLNPTIIKMGLSVDFFN